jgi:hypothetical protein
MFSAWYNEAKKLRNDEITKDDYDTWRYNYPRIEAERTQASHDAICREAKKNEDSNV